MSSLGNRFIWWFGVVTIPLQGYHRINDMIFNILCCFGGRVVTFLIFLIFFRMGHYMLSKTIESSNSTGNALLLTLFL